MAIEGEIHWHEGLFLQPHHLQFMQRQMFEKLRTEHRLSWTYSYGLIEARISDDQLESMLIAFDRLRIIMPSGLDVDVPRNASLPSLDITKAFAESSSPLTISLGVPMWSVSRGNVVQETEGQDWRAKRIYRQIEIERNDENTGEDPQKIQIRQINARLLLDKDDRSDLEVLPLLRIVREAGEDVELPRRDPAYIPPCLVLGGSPVLVELLRDLTNQVTAARSELVVQINRGGFSIENMRGVQFEQMLRLRTLNRFSAVLDSMIRVPSGVTPFEIYLQLRQLLSELAALRPDRDQFEVVGYDHDDPAVAFHTLSARIRPLLRGGPPRKYLKVSFAMDPAQGVLVADLSDEMLCLPNAYFLAIKTKQDPSELTQLVLNPSQFKLMPRSDSKRRVFGMQLARELFPPVQLPAHTNLHYFRLMRGESTPQWEGIVKDKAVAVVCPGIESSDFEVALYMTVPDTEV